MTHPYSKSDISDALKDCHGRIMWTSKELGLHKDTLYEYFKEHPDLWEVVDQARKTFRRYKNSKKVEFSEIYQDKLLTKEDVPYAIGLRASMYILDNLGQEEGYNKPKDEQTHTNATIKIIDARDNNSPQVQVQIISE